MISIVIPVLNEALYIGKLLEHLLAQSSSKNISEIIIVDGGSTDTTKNMVQNFSNFTNIPNKKAFNYLVDSVSENTSKSTETFITPIQLISSKKGRAKQMNLGAKTATGTILYFLHADSLPPEHFDQLIINEIKKGNEAGCFRMQFDSNHWWLKLSGWFTKFNWRPCRGGDQSQFITKTLFNDIGGFDERYIIYEDNILINELYARKQFVVINKTLKTSARMFEKHGVWRLQVFYLSVYFKKWLGATPDKLAQYYSKYFNVKKL
ncbi:TIGR04283 family arsenosugar biosynthesis glycosyltransferase [Algibacter sp.]|uniref:TIGR04283 family arsenosugar biosynthesis glycosyltransferase n=1 Tax=Algibacter sp. TaxID=1872428 RepID=UPI003C75E13B